MPNFGFVINNRTCIGCHACSTACKSENEVPLGVYRTWVKYTEVGHYPDVRRNFQVTRCNHCANPPCVRICPVTAMYQRDDGIVEFDPDVCIGCKACLQACPYDAIHIDPDTGTAAKCHYCAHRTDIGLEPACVVVCPEHAIIAGDLDDPHSEIRRVLAKEDVSVRKPEQGTAPKLFYIDGNDMALHPTATAVPDTFMWADVIDERGAPPAADRSHGRSKADSGTAILDPGPQAVPDGGPIHFAQGRMAEHMVQVGYNAQHQIPWHWPVPAYLVTKGIGAGVVFVWTLLFLAGWAPSDRATMFAVGGIGLFFTALTTALLVADLERPERFLRVLLRPQWKSWLVRGAYILVGYSLVLTAWLAMTFFDMPPNRPLLVAAAVLAVGSAVYTAFLFGQAEGRDLWQSALFPFHLLLQAVFLGAGALAIVDLASGRSASLAVGVFATSLIVDLFVTLAGEFAMPHASETAARAAHAITSGKYKTMFWWGAIVLGHVAPLALLWFGAAPATIAAFVLATVGLYFYEYAFVMAPQEVPNS